MLHYLSGRECGLDDPRTIAKAQKTIRTHYLQLSKYREFEAKHGGGVVTLDIDPVDDRYLLSGGADGSVVIYDLLSTSQTPCHTYPAVCSINRNHRHAHKKAVSSVQWYPIDTGIFTTSGMDQTLRIWDTNRMKPAEKFQFSSIIYSHSMSVIASRHSQVAVATSAGLVALVDLRSGSSTHEIRAHKSAALNAKYSPKDEFILATSGSDSKLKLWDIRSSRGCLTTFDQHNGDTSANPESENTAHSGKINGLVYLPDGLHLISLGTDDRMRLWDVNSGKNLMVNYGKIPNDSRKMIQIATSRYCHPDVVFVPNEHHINVYNLWEGNLIATLRGHFSLVNAIVWHDDTQEIFSGANDRNILIFSGNTQVEDAYSEHLESQKTVKNQGTNFVRRVGAAAQDAWSSDSDDD